MVEAGKNLLKRRKNFDENFKSVLQNSELKDFNEVSMVSKKDFYYFSRFFHCDAVVFFIVMQ